MSVRLNSSNNIDACRDVQKKVLMVFEKPGVFGYLAEQYLRAFYENGWHVTVCYLSGRVDEGYKGLLPAHGIVVFGLSKRAVRGLKLAAIRKMYELLRKESFDLVISHQYQANTSVGVAGLFRPGLIKYAVFHGIDPVSAFSRKVFYNTVGRRFFRFISVSDAQKINITKNCPGVSSSKVSVVHNVIDVDYALEKMKNPMEAREILGIDSHNFVIGTISRLTEDKRPLDILYAYKAIEDILPEGKLLIIGKGKLKQKILEEAERLGLYEKVACTGYIKNAWQLLRGFDLFVLPSKNESSGLVLLEAMCAMVPIVAADSRGVKESLGEAGCLFERGNHKDLAEKILKVQNLKAEKKRQMVDFGLQRVRSVFDKNIFQDRILFVVNNDLKYPSRM